MLKTLDILIGGTTVLLVFSMAVTVITSAVTAFFGRRGKHLMAGLSDLLLQLGVDTREAADKISEAVLTHPLISSSEKKLGTVIQREEFTKLLLDFASDQGASRLEADAKTSLVKMLNNNGIPDPAATLKAIRSASLHLEAAQPALSASVRQTMAILMSAKTDYVARINAWFDQTIDRVAERFTKYTHWITIGLSTAVVLFVQLDMIAVVDRLSIDEQFRSAFVESAVKDYSNDASAKVSPKPYYDLLGKSGLITLPSGNWFVQMEDWRKYPGMFLSILLISLGAPFWYNILKDLIGLRSSLTKKDDVDREVRQTAQEVETAATAAVTVTTPAPGAATPPAG